MQPSRAVPAQSLDALRADARHRRDRLALYRAKVMGPRPTSPARLRELEQASSRADERLAHGLRTSGEGCA